MATNENGEELRSVLVELSENESEELLIAIDMRRRQLGATGYPNDELGKRLAAVFEKQFGCDPGVWERIKVRTYRVKIV